MNSLPELFLTRLQEILPAEKYQNGLKSFSKTDLLVVRVNTLKISKEKILEILKNLNIQCAWIPEVRDALRLENITLRELQETEIFKSGLVYCQNLSSMLPVMALDPGPGERVLDMCAAPGSKTTQIAAFMKNEGSIMAIEAIKDRYYRLKSVVDSMGVKIVSMRLMDARRFRPLISHDRRTFSREHSPSRHHREFSQNQDLLFDRILLDAPCSSEGRFKTNDPKTYRYWSLRKIEEMVRKQRGLLLNASRWLKPGGVLVYSTCSFAPEENEGVLNWLFKKTQGKLISMPISFPKIETYPAITRWKGKIFDPQITNCVRVLPDEKMEGFFIAKLVLGREP